MIKYFKSVFHRGDTNLATPPGVKVSIAYIDKEDESYTYRVESEDLNLIDQFMMNINGVEVPKPYTSISPVRIKTLFPLDKLIAIQTSTDPGVKAILGILDDPRLTEVDRNKPFFTGAISYISSIIPLTPEETQRILTGV